MDIFIDCGAYRGAILKKFKSLNPQYKCYAFECNKALASTPYSEGVTVSNKAVWVHNNDMAFFINTKQPKIQGNSLYKSKTTGGLDTLHPEKIMCIDFSQWLQEKFSCQGHYIIVKMNIEGSEYVVLEKCLEDKSIDLINELHIQWHVQKIPCIDRARHDSLINKLKNIKTLKLYSGYGNLYKKR